VGLLLGCSAPSADEEAKPFESIGERREQLSSLDALALSKANNIMDVETLGLKNDVITLGSPGDALLKVDGIWAPPYIASDFLLTGRINGTATAAADFTWYPIEMKRSATVGSVSATSRLVLLNGQKTALVLLELKNNAASSSMLTLSFRASSTLDKRLADTDYRFSRASSSSPTSSSLADGNRTLKLTQGANAIALSSNSLTWTTAGIGTGSVTLPANGQTTIALSIAIGPSAQAAQNCRAALVSPTTLASASRNAYSAQLDDIYTRIPRLTTNNPQLQRFYERSAMHPLLNRWTTPEFFLDPYYSTGGIRGGTLSSYLWNFGEPWEVLALVDPEAVKSHIKAFTSSPGMLSSRYSFMPISGAATGTWYPVNQEKLIGLVHNYVRLTGDTAFLGESDGSATIMARVLENATLNEGSPASSMIDYGASGAHLELDDAASYNHVMPDLNGRRYESYKKAAELAVLFGDPTNASGLTAKADALAPSLKQALWNPTNRWFDYSSEGTKRTRYTVQMFYLLGSGVLDTEQELGLLNHLNESEFLSSFGLHSLSKQDTAYDAGDIDNGGPGSCTAFPLHIAERLYRMKAYQKAETILARILWWGERMPHWGDSFVAASMDYRRDTPLQATIDAIMGVQAVMFGMFGVDVGLDGSIHVSPHPPAFASQLSLQGIKLRGLAFDVAVDGSTFTVTKGGASLSAPIGASVRVAGTGLSLGTPASSFVDATVERGTTAVSGFPATGEVFAHDGSYVYWHSGSSLRRGQISGGSLVVDPTFTFDGVTAEDDFFAASGRTVYWRFANQVRRGTVGSGTLTIDRTFSNDGFSSEDRLFAAEGNTVYWQFGSQLRRAHVTSSQISIDSSFSVNNFAASDVAYAAKGNTVYWRTGNLLRCGLVSNAQVQTDPSCKINDFESGGTPFAMVGSRLYWSNGTAVKSRWMSADKITFNDSYKGFTSATNLVTVTGGQLYWQTANEVRRGTVSNGSLTLDPSFQTDQFDPVDRLFAISGSTLYWQAPSGALQAGTISGGQLSVNPALSTTDFTTADRLFAAAGNTVYWQSDNQFRRGTIANGHVTVDASFRSNDFSSVDRLFAVSGTTVYWQAGNQLRRAAIVNQHPVIDTSFSSNALSPNERAFAASGDNVFWQTL
jgi:hypothetical protein